MREEIKNIINNFDVEYVEDYKSWVKAKLKNKEDLIPLVKKLKEVGVKSCSTVSPTDFIDEGRIEVNYFLESLSPKISSKEKEKVNVWLKVDLDRDLENCEIDSITPIMPSANYHELEAYSTFGVKFKGHPNLRFFLISRDYYGKFPFRKDFDWKAHEKHLIENVNAITEEFLEEFEEHEKSVGHAGSRTVLHWGPTHPASGPIRLKVFTNGENIEKVEPDIGYVWRALENLSERKDFIGTIVAVERICFMDNPNPMICYSQAVEEIAGKEITEFAKYMRVILGEIGRIVSHLISMGNFFGTMGLQTFLMWCLDVREYFLDVLEDYSGARIATACIEPGGVRYPLNDYKAWFSEIQKAIEKWEKTKPDIEDIFLKNPLMTVRAKNTGVFSLEDVEEYFLTGPVARASGAKIDVRIDEPYAAYDKLEIDYVTCENGDARDRLYIIYKEINQSIDLIKQAMKKIKEGIEAGEMDPKKDHLVKMPRRMPEGEAVSRIEWARGEILMHLVTMPKSTSPYRLKIKAPSVNHTMMLEKLLPGHTLSDIPLLYGSMHICQGDLDR
ncbi:NADH-quinone oxidoreductase subunit C [Caminibacter mediatlanticus]|uniref:NADH dehydrogenase subunit D n=1 Tax=Caminibacter mediatlanticus TB-2 TaxID=391592 RepID=A0AAI9AGK8_9BACT|nr:NADH-quinone oxidoreductase subunit C [Caminibacter mediatlanticus]EDM23230.1 NADH dehydrogenase subunit D [Caminibacter mediatlanticus TB-2]